MSWGAIDVSVGKPDSKRLWAAVCCWMLVLPSVATASGIDFDAFSGNETVIDFEDIAPNELITDQYAAEGVRFAGGLFGDAFGFTSIQGNQEGANFASGEPIQNPISISFLSSPELVGMWVGGQQNSVDTIRLEAFRDGMLVDAIHVVPDTVAPGGTIPSRFAGLFVMGGIDVLEVSRITGNGSFSIDDLRFETPPIPEPSAALIFAVGALLSRASIARRRH
ncbi:MAG: hypothetical protein AAF430_07065 [Myxococcota bacterium]